MAGRLQFFLTALISITSSVALASTPSMTSTTQKVTPQKTFKENTRITDLELRAEAGSRSKYSMKFTFGYDGPQINRLQDEVQPNPNNSPGRHLANVSGTVGGRYRLSHNEAIDMSVGLRAYTPFSGLQDEEFRDPRLSYDRTFRWGELQGRSSISVSMTTTESYASRGQVASTGISQAFKYYLGSSSWVLGTQFSLSVFHFSRGFQESDGRMSNYFLNFIPSLEYKIANRINFNTSIAIPFSNLRSANSLTELEPQFLSQRVGLGWALTPEVYFNPYLGFYPEKLGWDNTSLSFNMIFSVL